MLIIAVLLQSSLVFGDAKPGLRSDRKSNGRPDKRDVEAVVLQQSAEKMVLGDMDTSASSQQASVDMSDPMMASASG